MTILDGKLVASETRKEIKAEAERLKAKTGRQPGLCVILVGDDPASAIYVRNKTKACEENGIRSFFFGLDKNATYDEVAAKITEANLNDEIDGIIVQLPLPSHLDTASLLDLIDPLKDVDGCHFVTKGKLWTGRDAIKACTPYGITKILDYYNIPLEGKTAVVVGRSNLVGKPLAQLLMDRNCTVTICHSKTTDLKSVTKTADIVCMATGKRGLLTADMVKEGAVVIDVGISRAENGKICGDVDFDNVKDKCSYITPVPGGVGPMTVTMLLYNTIEAFKCRLGEIK
ncbi:MAG: bifunctional methylenetetrahydrofolate dehydrogenase/methenyltetrahydrofolate cyclohydrolase FolD [Clostridia bacterium]|nr:bifunctional methylenetetrahydrofolate dehydrogenase/methenyltetrahydrofolate cyclohydrolase FolD [Clostridia bacterium]